MSQLEPIFTNIFNLDPAFALENAKWIRDHVPFYDRGNNSGKFYQNYETYSFWHDSQQPLIRAFVDGIYANADRFYERHKKKLNVQYVYLSYVKDASQESCIWHKDGYWWDGQFHLTIQGGANLLVEDGPITCSIVAQPGSAWYFNSTSYRHTISPGPQGERFELLAPCNFREEVAQRHFEAVTNTPERWIDSEHPSMVLERKEGYAVITKALERKTASNSQVANWSYRFEQENK